MLRPNYRINIQFFRRHLSKKLNEKYRRSLVRIGAFTRRVAKNSIRPASDKRKSRQNAKIPRDRTGALKRFIRYAVSPDATSVVIGPTLLPRPKNEFKAATVDATLRSATRVSILEFGGTERSRETGKLFRFKEKPFMRLALQKARESKNLKSAFREIGR